MPLSVLLRVDYYRERLIIREDSGADRIDHRCVLSTCSFD